MSRPRLAFSATDLALLLVMAALVRAHLQGTATGSVAALLFAAQHAAAFLLTIAHRPAAQARTPRADLALAWAGTLLPLAMRQTPGRASDLGLPPIILGSALATAAMLSLGRSFGMEPAHRGLKTGRLYSVVRHPIYASYLLIVGGFLLSAPSWPNALVALAWLAAQVARIRREEALLACDVRYRRYARRVRWRLVPGLW